MKTKVRGERLRSLFAVVLLVVVSVLTGTGVASATPTSASMQDVALDCVAWVYPSARDHSRARCVGKKGEVRADALCKNSAGQVWLVHGTWVSAWHGYVSVASCARPGAWVTWFNYSRRL